MVGVVVEWSLFMKVQVCEMELIILFFQTLFGMVRKIRSIRNGVEDEKIVFFLSVSKNEKMSSSIKPIASKSSMF